MKKKQRKIRKRKPRKTSNEQMQSWFKTNKEVIFHLEWLTSMQEASWKQLHEQITKMEARLQILEDEGRE